MMAESTKTAFDSPDWIFEIKLDGYRAITVFDAAGKPHLLSRNGLVLETKFPAIANAVSKLKLRSTVLDGEVVAVDENGIPRFQLLQRFQNQPTAPTLYYVFDVLWYEGDDLTGKTILERRSILERIAIHSVRDQITFQTQREVFLGVSGDHDHATENA
jgi:bifunctional non-homologous end joining protein LigD